MSTEKSSLPTSEKPRLSVAMIVRDASRHLVDTLESVRAIADEMVLLDTGSTDNTKEVAQLLGATVKEYAWENDFSAARNRCLSHVRGDWVIWLDAGERISAQAAEQLRDFIDSRPDKSKAFMLLVKSEPQAAHVDAEQVGRIRLVPNLPTIKFRGRVRESMEESLSGLGLVIEGLPWRIERGAHQQDMQEKILKAQRNLQLADLEIQDHGPSAQMLSCLGDALIILGEQDRGMESFRQALRLAERGSDIMLESYYGLLNAMDYLENIRQPQIAVCLEALEVFPLDAQLLCAMGGYLQAEGRLDLATRSYETAFQHGQVNPKAWHLDDITSIATVCYSLSLQVQKNDQQALDVLEQTFSSGNGSPRLLRHLIDLYIKLDKRDEALGLIAQLPEGTSHVEALRSAVRGGCLATKENWGPALAYLQTAFQDGCRDPLCLRWLSVVLISTGQLKEAKPILQIWETLDESSVEPKQYLDAIARSEQSSATAQPAEEAEKNYLRVDGKESDKSVPRPHPSVGDSSLSERPSRPSASQ